jgi:hypothetical protein
MELALILDQDINADTLTQTSLCIERGGSCDEDIIDILNLRGFEVKKAFSIPENLSDYDLIVITGIRNDDIPKLGILENYVNDGGGLVFIAGAADRLQGNAWLGFDYADYTSFGESAHISVEHPLDSRLVIGDVLKQQREDEAGAQTVYGVSGSIVATYSGGGVYAYYKDYGSGKIYYQADTNPSLAGNEARDHILNLLSAGINWAGRNYPLTTSFIQDTLPEGTLLTLDEPYPGKAHDIQFNMSGFQIHRFPNPEGYVKKLYSTVTTNVQGAILFFEVEEKTFSKSIDPNSDMVLTFPNPIEVSNVRIAIEDAQYADDAASLGYLATPSAPVGIIATTTCINDPEVKITWDALSDGSILQYNVYRTTSINQRPILVASLDETNYSDNVSSGVTYYYQVAAENEVGVGPLSKQTKITLDCPLDLGPIYTIIGIIAGGIISFFIAYSFHRRRAKKDS